MARSIVKEIQTFLKAQGSAILATACDYFMRVLLDKIIGIDYRLATFLGALTGGIVNCSVNYRWVFDGKDQRKRDIAFRYLVIWAGSVFLNTAGTTFFKEVVGMKAYFAMTFTSVLVAIGWNYGMQRFFVFRKKEHSNE